MTRVASTGRAARRRFGAWLAAGLLAGIVPTQAQPRVIRVGLLRPTAPPPGGDVMATELPQALRELGYDEGRNLRFVPRYADGRPDALPRLAAELVAAGCDVIVAVSLAAARAAKAATATIPIVVFGNFDPVAAGLVPELARPGGNVTGVLIAPDGTLAAKRLELLREMVPGAARIGFLGHEDDGLRSQEAEAHAAAGRIGVELVVATVRGGDYERAFAALSERRPAALLVGANTFFMVDRKRIVALAAKHRLPAIYEWPEQVADGGLMSYGARLPEAYRRIAAYIDHIARGRRPGDLPVERPAKLDLVINLRTAQALGLAIPPALLARADEVRQ